ncbi:MAG: EamA-like transporter family protein [Candidatus Methanofastidiosum methylothiophilum]|uniref:EamA-like transporter family protein n=1 Tax=Candidatus Methanofastidiosum methylothiophilum TaxID=1705564 RepID=A0A150IM94_9EURY|nr:MAG: EamA-like transporter family protein [Candidatus Methanofastidiosum methylthiophilus]KYC48184.1 MAG: EamA-like transporter family protein [Candidatus Methanofastidiosum methylthiophilus]KYC50839.1 MAG: EamA-like transporter family protein [Candidatus Methanofastidiosum methylthiophilus]
MKKDYWTIVISAIFFGLIIPGGQYFSNLGFSLYEISVYSLFFLFIFTLPIILIRKSFPIRRGNLVFFILYGLIGALLQLTQFGGVIFGTPVAIVALLLYTQPIWTTFFGRLILNEEISKIKIFSVVIAFLGVIFLLSPWNIDNIGNTKGLVSSLLAGIFLSLWVIFARKTGINKDYYINTLSAYSFLSLLWLILLFPLIKILYNSYYLTRLSYNFPISYWIYFGVFCLISAFMPNSLFYKAMEKVEASKAGVILLLEPVVASIVAMIIFSQYLTSSSFFGGGLILLSNYLAIKE